MKIWKILKKNNSKQSTDWSVIGDKLRDENKWPEAVAAYQKFLINNPRSEHIWVQLGHAYKESNNYKEAQLAYEKAVSINPNNYDTYLNYGHLMKLMGILSEASASYLKAAKLNPLAKDPRYELTHMVYPVDAIFLDNIDLGITSAYEKKYRSYQSGMSKQSSEFDSSKYNGLWSDVNLSVRLGNSPSPESHHYLYGQHQGRDVIKSLKNMPAKKAIVLCPSYGKRCGIGEYSRYYAESLISLGYDVKTVRTTRQINDFDESFLKDSVLVVNHGPGLFDGYNAQLSEGESTLDLISGLKYLYNNFNCRPIIYLHSLLDRDNEVMYGRQELLINSGIPVVTTILSAARYFDIPYVDHGVQPINLKDNYDITSKDITYPAIGFFGFYQWGGKDFDSLIDILKALKAKLVGSVATSSQTDIDHLHNVLKKAEVRCDLGTGWVADTELASRLKEADFFYLPQNDYDHWNNSGTARFVTNLSRPLLLPAHQSFLDMANVAIFVEKYDIPRTIAFLRDPVNYKEAIKRIEEYRVSYSMKVTTNIVVKNLYDAASNVWLENQEHCNEDSQQYKTWMFTINQEAIAKQMSGEAKLINVCLNYSPSRKHVDIGKLINVNPVDQIFTLYRTIAGRDPEYLEFSGEYPNFLSAVRNISSDAYARLFLKKIFSLLAFKITNSNKVPLVFVGSEVLSLDDIKNPANTLLANIQKSFNAAFAINAPDEYLSVESEPIAHSNNIFLLLLLPIDILCKSISSALKLDENIIKIEDDIYKGNIKDLFFAIIQIFNNYGARLEEKMLLDEIILAPINNNRHIYYIEEFLVFDGDAFIFNMVRCLMKREPLVAELHYYVYLITEKGRITTIQEYLEKNKTNATLIGLDNFAILDFENRLSEVWALIKDFRSPCAGGWDARNQYLIDKRNFGRAWLRNKAISDRWSDQGGAKIFL